MLNRRKVYFWLLSSHNKRPLIIGPFSTYIESRLKRTELGISAVVRPLPSDDRTAVADTIRWEIRLENEEEQL